MNAKTLTIEKILFGDPNRDYPDPIDELVLLEIAKAGRKGTTMIQVAERLLKRELTNEEVRLVDLSEEMDREEEE